MLVGAETFSNLFHFLYLSVHSKNLIQFPLYRIPNTSFKKMEKKVLHDFSANFLLFKSKSSKSQLMAQKFKYV